MAGLIDASGTTVLNVVGIYVGVTKIPARLVTPVGEVRDPVEMFQGAGGPESGEYVLGT